MKRSPAAAFWLSALPGLGHIYLGQTAKGFAFGLVTVGLINLVSSGRGDLFGILIPIYWFFVMIDAHRSTQAVNARIEAGADATGFLDGGDSKWWGGALIGIGIFFLLLNFDIIDLDWLWQFWPILLIVLGVRLIRPEFFPKPTAASPAQAAGEPPQADAESLSEGETDERAETS